MYSKKLNYKYISKVIESGKINLFTHVGDLYG